MITQRTCADDTTVSMPRTSSRAEAQQSVKQGEADNANSPKAQRGGVNVHEKDRGSMRLNERHGLDRPAVFFVRFLTSLTCLMYSFVYTASTVVHKDCYPHRLLLGVGCCATRDLRCCSTYWAAFILCLSLSAIAIPSTPPSVVLNFGWLVCLSALLPEQYERSC